ncbi:hypothetical protein [Symbiobacterium thermophilum]|uniref:Uncharacterized protein n=1 Tax=Symbiobacterium thermophilum TaxID=2734 RepID=A0A953I7G9_SYMTR|nr:hypothetical protein [Symbiobacterium thermophilum]MBY6278262.1 hypothetical protein [Symbiobacterium thermophilum]
MTQPAVEERHHPWCKDPNLTRQPICPIDRAAMIRGEDGVFRCRRQPRHEFRVMRERPRRTIPYDTYCPSNMSCPACQAEMQSVPGFPGLWVCTEDAAHILDLHPPILVCERPKELMRDNQWVNRGAVAGPTTHWLAHIGITTPLLPPPQSNGGDGTYCQPLGTIRHSGGSKSGRRRKKPKKVTRSYLIDFGW